MNKEDLIRKVSKESGVKQKKTDKIFNRVMILISKELKRRNEVTIEGFGSFKIKREQAKVVLKKNKERIVYPPKDTIEFIPAEILMNKMNSDGEK